MLSALSAENTEFLVVGAFALSAHGYTRATGDMDVWVHNTPDNAERVMRALVRFGAPVQDLTLADLSSPDVVFQIGVAPVRIDILTSIAGVEFNDAWNSRVMTCFNGNDYPTLGYTHLIQNKKAAGRPKDLNDVLWLEQNPPK